MSAFQNSGLRSNIRGTSHDTAIPSNPKVSKHTCCLNGDSVQVEFPVKVLQKVDLANKPGTSIEGYTANQKTMVQNMFNSRNLNENLNFKNTFYLEDRGEMADKEKNTIYDYDKVYPKQVIDSDLKAQLAAKTWQDRHIKSETKVKSGLAKTANNVAQIRDNEEKDFQDLAAKHGKEVKKYFKKAQNLVGVMVGTISPKDTQEKFSKAKHDEDDTDRINLQNIQKDPHDEEATLNNRATIRAFMGVRSVENQEKIQAEKEEKERIAAMEEAQRVKIEKQEEMRISKYMDLKKLSQTWRIFDKDKLKEVVRNEIMKDIMKEEERKNFEKIASHGKKTEAEKKTLIKQTTKLLEPPKAFSPVKKKAKNDKRYAFSPDRIQKLPAETQADFKTRFNYTVMALPKQKEALNPVEQHKIARRFQEMVVKNGVEKNGKIVLDMRK